MCKPVDVHIIGDLVETIVENSEHVQESPCVETSCRDANSRSLSLNNVAANQKITKDRRCCDEGTGIDVIVHGASVRFVHLVVGPCIYGSELKFSSVRTLIETYSCVGRRKY